MDFKELINARRSVNFFDSARGVPENLLREMVAMASQAPSSFNLQPWSLIVVKDPERKKRLQKLAWDQPKVSEAPVILIVLADRDAWQSGHPFVERNFQEMIRAGMMTEEQRDWFKNARESLYGYSDDARQAFANKNSGFFTMGLMLAAKSLGLETHPMDGFDLEGVRREFSIPENYWVPLLLAVGYFKDTESLAPPKWRKTYDEIVVNFK